MKSYNRSFKKLTVVITVFFLLIPIAECFGQVLTNDLLKNFRYREIGPTQQGGRYVDFAVVKGNTHIFYAATATGGLWKTVNNGITFESVFEPETVFSIGDVAVSESDPDIVWVGTGEANNSRSNYWGDGVYKSTDAGETWTNMGLKESHHIGRIVIHSTNPDIVYVAANGHLYSENPERGLYKTTDGGKTWTKSLDVVVRGKNIGAFDIVMNPKNPDILYASTYDKVRKPWTFNLGGPGSGIYKTTDAGRTWKKLTNGLPDPPLGKIGLTIFPDNPDILYTIIEDANKPGMPAEERIQELLDGKSSRGIYNDQAYRTDDGGETWRLVSPRDRRIGGGTPYYYAQIRVDPNDPDHVYNLSTRVDHSTDGGKTWTTAFRFGGDNHALWIDPDNSDHILLGHDHGMGITYDGGQNWYRPDNIPLAQFYAIGVDMDYPYNVYGGTQDNGSLKGPSTKRSGGAIRFEDWQSVGGGDGFYNVVDPTDSRWLYNESQFGAISRRDQKTGQSVGIKPQDRELRFNWNSPILISPHNPKVIYFGANKLFRSGTRGDVWEEISPDLTSPDPLKLTTGRGGDGNIQYSTITTVDESPIRAGVIWVGTDDGNVHLTQDGGQNWEKLNDRITGNPGYWVSRVTASHHFTGTAYVTYTGYRRDDFRPFVYKTTDFGETWTSIANNLPDESINVIKEDHKNPNLLFAGTELAVYVSIDGGMNWTKMKNNMPAQPVHDLVIHPRENDLVVGTHGRGFFITDISPLQQLDREVLSKNAHLFEIEPKVKWVNPGEKESSSSNFSGESEPAGIVVNYFLSGNAGDVKVTVYTGARAIFETSGPAEAGINSVVWRNFTMMTPEQIEQARRQPQPEQQQRGARFGRGRGAAAAPGEYTVTLTVDGQIAGKQKAVILEDFWYDK